MSMKLSNLKVHTVLSTSGSDQGAYFHGRDVFFVMKYFFRMYLEVSEILFIDSLGSMAI